ncbi:AraC family transcriptional regulator [Rhizobium laguerreae]|uniref:AraC-like DNA-binding protein n=2 Tax=Rhizobium laguerreae TaxID=1076926 RepID=A0A1S9GRJ9_9HYPH|nr:AraC family transcriptional regulator [Rhizobium laguerreae]MBB3160206.1 AraC-like DNA-binding protein [Rhizobium laguerreae]MBY3035755.1 AraC family transcriptional regulator [Rhizobium laguerreae]MBY3069487.1 AraC family transcriptional regulator [Rhizobium laguerreae]MBY3089721.1 AraC family transcriptional regulator [Rhizobium laguerreae]MBY3099744.1 AraC family transcriptional regulator [Rhizobium laguerreae]
MTETLLEAVRRYTETHADLSGLARTPIPGLATIRATMPSDMQYAISKPLVALVVQGAKRVTMGDDVFDFSAGDSLLITADVPTVSEITAASVGRPYYSLVLDLDPALIAELSVEMKLARVADGATVRVEPTDTEVADAALRLMRLLDRPASVPVLQAQLVREMHYWLLAGRHGTAIRRLGWPDGHVRRVARAVAVLRAEFAETVPVERLAAVAGMSPSSFHQHFRAVTSLSPLQFQKQLRLIEARRLMLAEGVPASHAAFAVGYESVPQFTREYGRMFGLSPVRDMKAARDRGPVAA